MSPETLGPAAAAWQRAAAAGGGYVAGGLCERDGGRMFGSAGIVSAHRVLEHYRKAHLLSGETNVLASGFAGVSTPLAAFGICTCYAPRFADLPFICCSAAEGPAGDAPAGPAPPDALAHLGHDLRGRR